MCGSRAVSIGDTLWLTGTLVAYVDSFEQHEDWAGVQSRAADECCARYSRPWLICCGRSSPLTGISSSALQLESTAEAYLRGHWMARNTELAVGDGALQGVILSHCLEDEQSPLSQLDEALRVIRPGGYLNVWLWGVKGAGQSPGPAIARRSLRRLRQWAAQRPMQLLEVTVMRRINGRILESKLGELGLPQRWWQQRKAALLRLEYRYGGSQGIGVRRLSSFARPVSVPVQGMTRV